MALLNPIDSRAALIPFFILLGSCGVTDPDIEADGIVRFLDIEGGCWTIQAGDDRLEPINLPSEFRIDGLRVRFEATDRVDQHSYCMAGRLVELEYIQVAG
jgi:hypothetical protein